MKFYVTDCFCIHQGLDVKSDLYNTHGVMYFTAQELVKGRSVGIVKYPHPINEAAQHCLI